MLLQKSTESTQPHTEAYRPPTPTQTPRAGDETRVSASASGKSAHRNRFSQSVRSAGGAQTGICDYISPSNKI